MAEAVVTRKKPRRVTIAITLPPALAGWVRAKAQHDRRTISAIVEDALRDLWDPGH